MKLKYYIMAAALMPAYLNAASVVVATTGDGVIIADNQARAVYDSMGVALGFGSGFTAVGAFVSATPDFSTQTGSQIESAFTLLGITGTFGITISSSDINGLFSHNATGSITAGNPLIGETIFFVSGNGADFASSTQMLIINMGVTFAADDPLFSQSFALQSGAGTVVFGSSAFNGSSSPIFGTFVGASDSYQMATLIPEPSVALLGAFGILALLRRQR